jgi:hypothetical protein
LLERISAEQDRLKIIHPNVRVDKPLKVLRNIRKNQSVRAHFQTMYNQCAVLAVSYFTSAVRDVFTLRLEAALRAGPPSALFTESLTLTFPDVEHMTGDPVARFAELFVQKKDISFQDMQSIGRAFKLWIGQDVERTIDVNDVITAHACRHAIVHNAGIVDKKLLAQVRDASPRRIQQSFAAGAAIRFSPDEIRTVGTRMVAYVG